ncbi:MAG: 3-dehydroquinate synthase [Microscillaceae bacterium]|nr:3-dehydroquinate synthase [Microscillaceae bacterium]
MEIIQNYVYLADNQLAELQEIIAQKDFTKIALLVDENTHRYCYPLIRDFLPKHQIIEIPSGEEHKNLQTCTHIWEEMTKAGLDRKSLLINLGGGVVGDMGGFCAATYKRGIAFIQVPTTLLAQVDASVGGKLGIDFQGFKNHIGVFQEPELVWIDTTFLKTVSESELRSGFAEIIKHCLIADAAQWKELLEKIDFSLGFQALIQQETQRISQLVAHSVKIKAQIVEADPLEKGQRKLLNFGHTLGHAIETFYLFDPEKKLLHGEAIAVGMICESWIAWQRGFLSAEEFQEISAFIQSIYPKILLQEVDFQKIIALTLQDKKNQGNQVLMTLLEGIGKGVYNIAVSEDEMRASLKYYAHAD